MPGGLFINSKHYEMKEDIKKKVNISKVPLPNFLHQGKNFMCTLASRILPNIFFVYAETLSVLFSLDLQECLYSEIGKGK